MKKLIAIFVCIYSIFLNINTESRKVYKKSGYLLPPPTLEGAILPNEQWFIQNLDHFDPTNNKTWNQRYYSNGSFYKPGGPVFLMIGGEGPASPVWMTTGAWHTYAKNLNAHLFQLEHRFYGKSHPTSDTSIDNLRYLTSEQALVDLATFIVAMKEKHGFSDNKWVSFGGSYPGTLSAWLRMKYPHLIHAAVSSSAPVLAKVNFKEYLEVVDDALLTTGKQCNVAVMEATKQLNMLIHHRLGWQSITQSFRLCEPLNGLNNMDVSNLFSTLAGNFEEVVQYNRDNRAFENVKGSNVTIDDLCSIMTNVSLGSELTRYATINSMTLDIQEEKCLEHTYSSMVEAMQNIDWEKNEDIGGRAWTYQTCTEYGFYQGSDSINQPFGNKFPAKFFVQMCSDVFGPKFTESLLTSGVKRTNTLYGSKNLRVTKVVFINGSIDPWHALGITKNISSEAPAIFINGTAHCANMYPESPNDLPQLVNARKELFTHLQRWLKE